MSYLRILGILVGLVGISASFIIFRGPQWNRKNFLVTGFIGLSLLIVSVNPNAANVLKRLFLLETVELGRLIALIILSNIFLWCLVIYLKIARDKQNFQFDRLVRKLGEEEAKSLMAAPSFAKTDVAVLIPAYNEGESLRKLISGIPKTIHDNTV